MSPSIPFETRPAVDAGLDADAFARWYWPVEALKQFCELLGLPATGTKALLRARVAFALAHPGEPLPKALLGRKKSGKAWPDGDLSPDTVITENASFGPEAPLGEVRPDGRVQRRRGRAVAP
ncbi:MAG: SAP domain-containing protein, partial [Pseudomonadota bacterium]